jgi:enoyl-CoA hydratase/carnithine racemase
MAVRIETQGAVATVVIDRPERKNAVDAQTSRDLADAFRSVESDEAIGAAVLWRAGETFCAGADPKTIGSEGSRIKPRSDRRSVYETWGMELEDALAREYELGKATIDSGESFEGAARFAAGAGRHGAPAS